MEYNTRDAPKKLNGTIRNNEQLGTLPMFLEILVQGTQYLLGG
jgi:hypothetical protein